MNGLLLALLLAVPVQERPKKVVLLAGPLDTHPRDTHEYERNILLLRHCLAQSPLFKQVNIETHFNGWPADPATLDDADTIFMTSGGCDRRLEDHPLYVGERLAVLGRQMKRGCGVIFFHWSTFHPAKHHDAITEWAGGYFDYETGPGANKWYSRIQTKEWMTAIGAPGHPVARGVKPFKLKEEFYSRIRFREEDSRLTHVLLQEAGDVRANSVGWAVERADGGRGFGFTGGHFYANWWNEDYRRLILNAIAWTAKLEVPAEGVGPTLEPLVRTLILTGHNHPAHDWKTTTPALLGVLERDPRLRVDVCEDPAELATRLENVDLLVLNYNNWDQPGLSEPAKAGLLKFLARGGGLSVIHFANGAWNKTLPAKDSEWEEYRARLVRRAWMHPDSTHDAFGTFRVEIPPLKHEIIEGLKAFDTVDELYVKQGGELPIEPLAFARSKITGKDEPLAWAYEIGTARAFQTLLGHSAESIRKAGDLIRRGSVWAARRGPLEFDPPALPEQVLQRPGAWKPKPSEKKSQVLPSDPGMDGGKGGHWGMKGEKDWADARWSQMDTGPFMSSSLKTPGGAVPRAISIRLPDGGVCFDADALGVRASWSGAFLAFSPTRYGLIEMPRIGGDVRQSAPAGPLWNEAGTYKGLFLHGSRVVLTYEVGGTPVLELPELQSRTWKFGPRPKALTLALVEGPLDAAVSGPASLRRDGSRLYLDIPAGESAVLIKVGPTKSEPEDPELLTKGAPGRWEAQPPLKGQLGREPGPYVLDTVPVPFVNPWKALLFLTGLDFFENGDAAVCTVHGDVWRVSGIDATLAAVRWKRMATGLFQPLGLRIVDGLVHVLGRDRITRLRDLNGDGEADVYESLAPLGMTSLGGHDYAAGLESDAEGNFYYVDPKGLHQVSRDGARHRTIASGWRNPIALSRSADGTLTVSPQEGEWTPASSITIAREGGWYGYGGPRPAPERPLGYDVPLCWIPRGVDNSTGGQAWVESERWGPLNGQLLSFSFGQSSMMLVLREQVGGLWQGGVVPFRLSFASGAVRGRFSPADGQLYVVGTKGWVTNAVRDGCLQRVRYTGAPVVLPVAMKTLPGALKLTFSAPLERETAESTDRWAAEMWNYVYAAAYGSKEYSVLQSGVEGHDELELAAAALSEDGLTVTLKLPSLRPVMQLRMRYNLRSAAGAPVKGELSATIHRVGG